VAFGLELAALAVLGWGGWQLGGPAAVRLLLAVALPAVAGLLWSLFAAPRATFATGGGRLAVQALVFGAAALPSVESPSA
jgi:hypothetical protein